jgi:hypothetical protein
MIALSLFNVTARLLRLAAIAWVALAAVFFDSSRTIPAHAAGGWRYRMPVTIGNSGDTELSFHQVRVVLRAPGFDFSLARADLADLRFTEGDGARYVPHWLQSFDGEEAIVWVKVPRVERAGSTQLFLYFGNAAAQSLSSGARVFEFFDDFGAPGPGYFALGPPETIGVQDQPWETQAPHTLSVVDLNQDGYRYWGYYGLADCGGIGVMRSNDLKSWQKMAQPLLNTDGERWPSAHRDGEKIYLVYDRAHCQTSHIVMRVSRDGTRFDAPYVTLVALEPGVRNQNPHLFWNPADRRYYLYWFRGGEEIGRWQIKVRSALRPEDLASTSTERVLLDVPYTLAAPHMLLHEGVYYLSTEVNENAWKTKIYVGPSALGPFEPTPGSIILSNNEACWFQHVFAGALHGLYCKDTRGDGKGWVLQQRVGDLGARVESRALDPTFWQPPSGEWRIDGALMLGPGAMARTTIPFGPDRVLEADGDPSSTVRELARDTTSAIELTGGASGARFTNVRARKRDAAAPPDIALGARETRRDSRQPWFDVGEQQHGVPDPATLPFGLVIIGPAFLLALALAIANMTAKRRLN